MSLESNEHITRPLQDTSAGILSADQARPVLYRENSYGQRAKAINQAQPKHLALSHHRTASTDSNISESDLPTPRDTRNVLDSLDTRLASSAMNNETSQAGSSPQSGLLAKRRPQFHLPEASTSYSPGIKANSESETSASHIRTPLSANAPLLSPSACYVHSQFDSALSNTSAMNQQSEERKARRKRRKAGQRTPSGIDAQKSPEIHSMMSSVVQSLNNANNMDTPRRNPANLHPNATEDDSDSSTASEDDTSGLSESEDEASSLTRKLAETATSVREMSKQLGRARIKSNINSIMIITKARDNHLIRLTREMAIWIMTEMPSNKERGVTVYVDHQLKKSKRFDAAGIERDYPYLFRPLARRPSRRGSAVSVPTLSSLAEGNLGTARRSKVNIKLTSSTPASRPTTPYTTGHGREPSGDSDEGQLRYWDAAMCTQSPQLFDFVITLGGDGTVLFASWLFQRVSPPIIPFSLGSLGFLTNQDFKHHQKVLSSVANDGVRVNLRMRFTCTVYRAVESDCGRRAVRSGKTGQIFTSDLSTDDWDTIEGGATKCLENGKDKEVMCFTTRPVEQFEVINDLTVDRGPSPYVSLLELFGDEQHITTVQADGLCISTPTGSTAYSLSAGGSLVHPEIPAILVTPICPHTLSFRPVLLPDSMEIRLCVPYNSRATAWASFDGRGRIELRQGDHIKVTASQYPFPTVCAETQSSDWFHSIARTLKWNERQRQKSFVVIEEDKQSEPLKDDSPEKNQTGDTAHVPRPQAEEVEDEDATYDIDDVSEASTPSSPKAKTDARKSSVSKATEDSTHSLHDVLVDRFATSSPQPPRLSHRHTAASRLEHEYTPHDGESGDRDWVHEPEQKRSNGSSTRFAPKKPLSPTKAKEALEQDRISRRPSQSSGHRAFAMFGEDHSESESEISESPE